LCCRCGDVVMAVSVKTEPTLRLATPQLLFRGTYVSASTSLPDVDPNPWDISPDGKRFLMLKALQGPGESTADGGPRKINIVLNRTEELKQRVHVK
jgi:hypothetical protein